MARGRQDTQKKMALWGAEKVQSVLESGRAVLGVQGRTSCSLRDTEVEVLSRHAGGVGWQVKDGSGALRR